MMEIMRREVTSSELREVVTKLIPDSIGKDIAKACNSIYPLHDVYVRKVKVLKKPKFEACQIFVYCNDTRSRRISFGGQVLAKTNQGSGYYTETDNDDCVVKCAMRHGFISLFEEGPYNKDSFNKTILEQSCRELPNLNVCLHNCYESSLKRILAEYESPRNYTCSSIVQRIDCYAGVFNEIKGTCETTCAQQITRLSETWDTMITSGVNDVQQENEYFVSQCQYLDCFFNCSRQTFVDKCTSESFEIFASLIQRYINAAKKSREAIGIELDFIRSESCANLMKITEENETK